MKKYLAEGLLIVFSVLFALFINKTFEDYQTGRRKAVAEQGIVQELRRNLSTLQGWKERHGMILQRITGLLDGRNDSLRTQLQQASYLNLGALTANEALIDAPLTNTAWESAGTSGIISEFDYETIQKLTQVYTLQGYLADGTVKEIIKYYFSSEAHDMAQLDRALIQFQLRFQELTGQEELLVLLYEDALQQLDP